MNYFSMDALNYSITISPINEEILKAIPLIIFALVFAKKGDQIIPLAFAVGIGFGVLENIIIYCITIIWNLWLYSFSYCIS